MHEMSMVRKLVDIVLEECKNTDVVRVEAVHLSIGALSDVIEEYVGDLFRFLAKDTPAQDARVVISRVPATARCLECSNIFPINVKDESTWECPRCHTRKKYRLFSGREFRIDRIDVEFAHNHVEVA